MPTSIVDAEPLAQDIPSTAVNPQPERPAAFHALDAWRGFASLWVAMYHMALVIVDRYPELRANPIYAFSLHGNLGVQLFFVISGYCIANAAAAMHLKGRGLAPYMAARIRRIYPTCWYALALTGALSALAELAAASGRLGPSTMADKHLLHQGLVFFFANATLTQGFLHTQSILVQTWTLCYEVSFYVIVGLALAAMARRFGERGMLTSLHVLTAATLAILVAAPHGLRYPLDLWPQFGLGILVYDVVRHRSELRPRVWAAILVGLTLAFTLAHNDRIGLMPGESRLPFAVCTGFALLLLATHRADVRLSRSWIFRWLAWVGTFSYSLYLTHTLSIGVVNQFYKYLHLPESFHFVAFVLVIALSVLFARVFYRYCEAPFVSRSRRAGQTPAAPAQVSSLGQAAIEPVS